jgi:hypothetical protein
LCVEYRWLVASLARYTTSFMREVSRTLMLCKIHQPKRQ